MKIKKLFSKIFLIMFVLYAIFPKLNVVKASDSDLNVNIVSKNSTNVSLNDEMDININIELPKNNPNFIPGITALGLEVSYDSSVLQFVSGTPGTAQGIISNDFEPITVKSTEGKMIITYSTMNKGITENGLFYTIKLKAIAKPEGNATKVNVGLRKSPDGTPVDYGLNLINTSFISAGVVDVTFLSDTDNDGAPDANNVSSNDSNNADTDDSNKSVDTKENSIENNGNTDKDKYNDKIEKSNRYKQFISNRNNRYKWKWNKKQSKYKRYIPSRNSNYRWYRR